MSPDDVRAAVSQHPAVTSIGLIGSRARGDATPHSDWDYAVRTSDFATVRDALPAIVAPLRPLTTLWDPLAECATFMLILHGPTKVDLLFVDVPFEQLPPYEASAAKLPGIDSHFWDWALWLVSKQAKGEDELVRSELEKMAWYILSPMGIDRTPTELTEAVDLYLPARDELEERSGVRAPRELGDEVARTVRRLFGGSRSAPSDAEAS